jgi:hypothetical protein
MQEKVTNIEIALSTVESEAEVKYEKLLEDSATAIQELKKEQEGYRAQLLSLKIELETALKYKLQVAHLQQLENKSHLQLNQCQQQILKQNDIQNKLQEELTQSRLREAALGKSLSQLLVEKENYNNLSANNTNSNTGMFIIIIFSSGSSSSSSSSNTVNI